MTDKTAHTPVPWRADVMIAGSIDIYGPVGVGEESHVGCAYHIEGPDGDNEADANARLIVQAVNLHDELVEALGAAADSLDGILSKNGKSITGMELIRGAAVIQRASALLQKASDQGGQP